MASLSKYDLKGKELDKVKVQKKTLEVKINPQLVKDYVVALQANKRQWSASTKERSDVSCTTAKPHPQKGTGRARQGSLAAPQFKGGGIVFGPKPKPDLIRTRINKKERQKTIKALLAEKMLEGKCHILNLDDIKEAKTKTVDSFLKTIGVKGKRVLFLGPTMFSGKDGEDLKEKCALFVKSVRNIPRVSFMPAQAINGYDVMKNHELIVMEQAFDEVLTMLGRVS